MTIRCFFLLPLLLLQGCVTTSVSDFVVRGGAFALVKEHRVAQERLAVGAKAAEDGDFILKGHDIVPGEGAIIALREASGDNVASDSGGFRKVTIWLPNDNLSPGRVVNFSPSIIGFWSTSGTNFPGVFGCFGYATSGTIEISEISQKFAKLKIDLHFATVATVGPRDPCEKISITRVITAEIKRHDQLTYWDGKPGGSLFEKSHQN